MATRAVVNAASDEAVKPPRHAGRNKELEDWLNSEGVRWSFQPNVPLDAFDEASSLGNQVRFVPINPSVVEQYAKAMTEGAKFPPLLVHQKGRKFVRLDGNHRTAALRAVGEEAVHVYEVHVNAQQATLLAFKANNRNGLPNTEAERIEHGLYMLKSGASLKIAAAEVVVSERALRAAWNKIEANARADATGVLRNEWESLTPAVRGRLKTISTDEGFKAATNLAFKAKLAIDEVSELVTEMNTSKSGRKQEAVVKNWLAIYADRIANTAGGKLATSGMRKGRTPKQALGLMLSGLSSLPEDMGQMAELYMGSERAETAERVRAAAQRLTVLADKLDAEA